MTIQDYARKVEAFAKDHAATSEEGARSGPAADWSAPLGRVVSVSGSQVILLLDGARGELVGGPRAVQMGTLVKMRTPESVVFGMVGGLSVPIPAQRAGEPEMRIVEVELVGEMVEGSNRSMQIFQRGVSFCPALGDEVHVASQEDLRNVYARPAVPSARVGTIYQDQTLPAFVSVDDLLGKHFAILGTTGSGKSCAVAAILRGILSDHDTAHVLLLDLHNEYTRAFEDCAEILDTGELELPYWMLSFEELKEIIIGRVEHREADTAILKDAVIDAKDSYHEGSRQVGRLNADVPVPYQMSDVLRRIDISLGKLNKPTDSAPYLRLKDRISALQSDRRYAFMFEEGLKVRDNMSQILSRVFRVPVDGKPLTILDLSDVPSEIMNVVIALICRLTFDFALWTDRDMPVMLVCEEAHRYAADGDDSFAMTRRALSQIANEGRKYGVSLCLVSQRPSELSVGILSQCNTIFAMRMSNQKDQDFVETRLSESAMGLLDSLPSLRTGEAIGVGEGVSVPVRLYFDLLPAEQLPRSGTASFSSAWRGEGRDEAYIEDIVERWRNQHR
jgi:hypothetical protein